MINFDGDRSKRRKWFAEKQLAVIHDMDVPSKALKWDGFTFRVWQQGELDGGRITSPMGAIATCSTTTGVKIAVADYWAGAFNAAQDLYVAYTVIVGDGDVTAFFNDSIDPLDTGEFFTFKFSPAVSQSPYGLIDGDTSGPDTVWATNYSCAPLIIPKVGELFDIIIADSANNYDLDKNGIPDGFRSIFEKGSTFYLANGKQLTRKQCSIKHIQYSVAYNPLRVWQRSGEDRYTSYHSTDLYDFSSGIKVIGYNIDVLNEVSDDIKFSEILTSAVPPGLKLILETSLNDGSCEPIGSYATDTIFFHAVNASTHVFSGGPETCAAATYYTTHPEDDDWRLFYSMTVNGTVYLVNYSQFGALLDSLSLHGTSGDWYKAKLMLEQLTGAYPNCNFTVPYDSVMFHAHDGNLYTWTRAYGVVQISTTGITVASLTIPTEVSESGVRPEITYAGTFDTVPIYLCICNKVKEEVKAVYVGSPFGSWIKLPGVDTGLTLMHVRPCKVTPSSIFLIGIIKETIDIDGVLTDYYSFASLNWYIDSEGVASIDTWKKMGRLPFDVGTADNLQVGLYGDDSRANDLAAYLSPPPIMPQSPVGPYDKYIIGLP